MPSSILSADTGFPSFTGEESAEERDEIILNYLYMLLEQLRYSLNNLGVSNFNDSELATITDPIIAQIEDTEGNVASLYLTASTLLLQMEDVEGNVSTLIQTAENLAARLTDEDGNESSLVATSQLLQAQISSTAESLESTITQTATTLKSEISSTASDLETSFTQTISSLTLSATNGESSSTLKLTASGTTLSSTTITFTGYVTFTDLETEGSTTICGGNIDTDTLQVSDLYGRRVYLRTSDGTAAGRFTVTGADSSDFEILMESYGALEILANTGAVFIESYSDYEGTQSAYVQLGNYNISFGPSACVVRPSTDASQTLGNSSYRWSTIYSNNSTISTSDRAEKENISYDLSTYDGLFDRLQPCSFTRVNGDRTHTGLVSQDVFEALEAEGLTAEDFAAACCDELEAGGERYGLRYEEFIGLLIYEVQKLKQRVTELEGG